MGTRTTILIQDEQKQPPQKNTKSGNPDHQKENIERQETKEIKSK